MKKLKVCLISLGCSKNLVDSENILGYLIDSNFTLTEKTNNADLIIVNTCGFITSSKKESIETIYEVLESKKKNALVVICGCLVQRYKKDLSEAFGDVSLFLSISEYPLIKEKLNNLFKQNYFYHDKLDYKKRLITTGSNFAYLKISEGCNNNCTYCAIPLIRGSFVSRDFSEIVDEFKDLVSKGIYEVCLISQDLTNYGYDINTNLSSLLKELIKTEGYYLIRLLYLYPDEVSDELIEVIKNNQDKIIPYFDIPIQHASDKVLMKMNRRGNRGYLLNLFSKIKKEIPESILRTTVIVGFPGETEDDFNILKDFIQEVGFDRLGGFTYSQEEDTKSFDYEEQIEESVKEKRLEEIMNIQKQISYKKNLSLVGKVFDCIIDYYDQELFCFVGRTKAFAPEDVDGGCLIFDDNLEIGFVYKVKVIEADFYDLVCCVYEEE